MVQTEEFRGVWMTKYMTEILDARIGKSHGMQERRTGEDKERNALEQGESESCNTR